MLSTKTYAKILGANEETRNKMIEQMTEENAKHMLKMVLKAVMPSDETREIHRELLEIETYQ